MPEAINILMAEDNAGDRIFIREMLEETGITVHIDEVTNGADALSFLRREGSYANAPRPRLVILDLNMPRLGGKEFLERADQLLEGVAVLVFSGSPGAAQPVDPRHRRMVKPATGEEFDAAVAELRTILQEIGRSHH